MNIAEQKYNTHNAKLFAIIEAFKAWRHYFASNKHKLFVFIDHIYFLNFIDTKKPSLKQVRWVPNFPVPFSDRLLCRNVQLSYRCLFLFCPKKANKEPFYIENEKILHQLEISLTNTSPSKLQLSNFPSRVHQILICGTYVLL